MIQDASSLPPDFPAIEAPAETLTAPSFYILSDLHLVGTEVKDPFICEEELIQLLDEIDAHEGAAVVFLGDMFDFWQMNGTPSENFANIRQAHPGMFDKLQEIGARHPIYLLPGNHDREAACDQELRQVLAANGIETIQSELIRLDVSDGTRPSAHIVAEHGHDGDPYNRYEYAPTLAEKPFAEHLMRLFINPIKTLETGDEAPWLRDVDNVNPLGAIPWWAASKYFYHEAGWWIRALALPAALVFTLTQIGILLWALQFLGFDIAAWGLPRIPKPILYMLAALIGFDAVLLVLAGIIYVLRWDGKKVLRRWGIEDLDETLRQRQKRSREQAARILDKTGASLYLYGHTHDADLKPFDESRHWCNTGTWMKRILRIRARHHLPPVFVPAFKLTYVYLSVGTKQRTRVELRARKKVIDPGLTRLERAVLWGRKLPTQIDRDDILLESLDLPAMEEE